MRVLLRVTPTVLYRSRPALRIVPATDEALGELDFEILRASWFVPIARIPVRYAPSRGPHGVLKASCNRESFPSS